MTLRTFLLYWNTIRPLRPYQIYGRIWGEGKRKLKLFGRFTTPNRLQASPLGKVCFIPHDPWNKAEQIRQGQLTFLGQTLQLGNPLQWKQTTKTPMLWQFNLHYGHFLPLLEPDEQERFCLDWIQNHPLGTPVAWHPYTISLRLVQWIKLGLNSPEILTSIYQQAAFLYRNLESYHPGNHYLENAKALVFAALYLPNQGESSRWFDKASHIIRSEMKDQLLSDGGYFERTPMYHALMVELCLDLCNILERGTELDNFLRAMIGPMLGFLRSMTHPNGEIALFNDSSVEIAPSTSELCKYAEDLDLFGDIDSGDFWQSGFHVFRDKDIYFVADAGPLGPDYLMAHAHADIFSCEFSLGAEKVLVDTGTFQYQAGPMRDHVRSTKAHNTLYIDNQSQAEVWGSFRVARRFPPKNVTATRTSDRMEVQGDFDGWATLIGDRLKHHRKLELDAQNRTLTITDTVTGAGCHTVSIPLHFGPNFQVKFTATNQFQLASIKQKLTAKSSLLDGTAPSQLEFSSADYCPEFGNKFKIERACVNICQEMPVYHRWTLTWE
jgi:uncharacterized heparinase superfamily protein